MNPCSHHPPPSTELSTSTPSSSSTQEQHYNSSIPTMPGLPNITIRLGPILYQPYRIHAHPHTYSTLSSSEQFKGQSKAQLNRRNPFPYPSHISNPNPHQIFHLPFGASQQDIKTRYFDLVRLHHPDSSHIRTRSPPLSPDIAHARFRAIKAAYDFLSGKTRSPHPNARPYHPHHPRSASHFDPYLHELARRRRAHHNASYAHSHARNGDSDWSDEGWGPRRGWADGFGAPKDQQAEWNQDGWRERLILSLGVVALLAGLFPSLPYTLASLFAPHLSSPPTSASFISSHSIFPDIYKNHREAASALSQVRQETREVGVERREGMKRKVKEMAERTADESEEEEEKKS